MRDGFTREKKKPMPLHAFNEKWRKRKLLKTPSYSSAKCQVKEFHGITVFKKITQKHGTPLFPCIHVSPINGMREEVKEFRIEKQILLHLEPKLHRDPRRRKPHLFLSDHELKECNSLHAYNKNETAPKTKQCKPPPRDRIKWNRTTLATPCTTKQTPHNKHVLFTHLIIQQTKTYMIHAFLVKQLYTIIDELQRKHIQTANQCTMHKTEKSSSKQNRIQS